jgi:hypothetical protein
MAQSEYKITLSYYDLELRETIELPISLSEEGKDIITNDLFDELMNNAISIKIEGL